MCYKHVRTLLSHVCIVVITIVCSYAHNACVSNIIKFKIIDLEIYLKIVILYSWKLYLLEDKKQKRIVAITERVQPPCGTTESPALLEQWSMLDH